MIIAQGRGRTTLLIIVVSMSVVLLIDSWTGHLVPEWVTYFAMAVPAAIGNAMLVVPAARRDRRIEIDPDTGQRFEVAATNSLFWIPVRFWTFIILIYPVIGTWELWRK
jgi:hypothetical protein